MVTQQRLKELLGYDPNTGVFTRLVATRLLPTGYEYGSGAASRRNYVGIYIDGRQYSGHRLAWMYVYGFFPRRPLLLDHINRIRHDNRIANLRLSTHAENMQNRTRRPTGIPRYNHMAEANKRFLASLKG